MDKRKQPLNPLLTPSASPAPRSDRPSRYSCVSEGPSPTKRSRLSRSSSSVSTPPAVSFSNQTYHIENGRDLHDARRASSSRVLDIWSSLAERYNRPLADDDIVDLRTGDVIKDRNVLRSTSTDYNIGYFGDPQADTDGTDTPTDEGADSEDELNSFAPGADISDELEMERVYREGVLPVTEMDPADAEDLKEFLEAEKRRREVFGSDGEEAESYGEGDEDDPRVYEGAGNSFDELEHGLSDKDERSKLDPDQEQEKDDLSQSINPPEDDSGSGSEDELGGWEEKDEGSTVYVIAGDLNSEDAGNVVELPFDPPLSPEPPDLARTAKLSQIDTKSQNRVRKSTWKTEVVIPYRSSSSPNIIHNKSSQNKNAHSHPYTEDIIDISDDGHVGPQVTLPRPPKTSKGKGKKKADTHQADLPSEDGESDDPVVLSPKVSKRLLTSDLESLSTPPPSTRTPSKGRKRKRLSSSSLSPEFEHHGDWRGASNPGPSIVSPEIGLTDFVGRRHGTHAMDQTSPSPSAKSYGKCTMRSSKVHKQTIGTCRILIEGPNPNSNSADKEDQPVIVPKRSKSRAHMPTPSVPSAGAHHCQTYSPRPQQDSNHFRHYNRGHSTYSDPPPHLGPQIQGPQAQFLLAQAIQHLSYLMSASGHALSLPTMDQPTWPQIPSPLPFAQPPFNPSDPPYSTPIHHYHRSRSEFRAPSPVASTSSAYRTPSDQRSYTSAFGPSSATLPPSSPYETSSPNAAAGRFPSLVRGRSKSKGRRVSFVIDDDRSHGLSDFESSPQLDHNDPTSDEYSSPSKRARESSKRGRNKNRKRELSSDRASEQRSSSSDSKHVKNKKEMGQSASIEEASDADEPQTHSSDNHRTQDRAQTPGPPSAPATRSRSRIKRNG